MMAFDLLSTCPAPWQGVRPLNAPPEPQRSRPFRPEVVEALFWWTTWESQNHWEAFKSLEMPPFLERCLQKMHINLPFPIPFSPSSFSTTPTPYLGIPPPSPKQWTTTTTLNAGGFLRASLQMPSRPSRTPIGGAKRRVARLGFGVLDFFLGAIIVDEEENSNNKV